jgi:hypothetical protein
VANLGRVHKSVGVAGVVLSACLLALLAPSGADAARLARVAGFSAPTFVTTTRGAGPGGLFVVQREGTVVRFRKGSRTTFANLTSRVSCCDGERGLASMAFDPDWATNRRVYFFYTNNDGDLIVARFRANSRGTRIVSSSIHSMLHVGHGAQSNHNGGQIAFGPDGRLYVGTGDGGGSCDQYHNGQSFRRRLAKVLRINVATGGVTTFFYGVRNPWRFSFDRASGNFWLADVGQSAQEEIDFRKDSQLHPSDPWNGGWNHYEGRVSSSQSGCTPDPLNDRGRLVSPLSVYGHSSGDCSITGGYVYRGTSLSFRGWYVYGDFCTGRIWRLRRHSDGSVTRRLIVDSGLSISSFGEGKSGEIYVADLNGAVYRLVPSS